MGLSISSTCTSIVCGLMDRDSTELSIQYIKGVGPQRARLLGRLNIRTVRDALFYLPYRYEDRRSIRKICDLNCSAFESIAGSIVGTGVVRLPKRNLRIFELTVSDGTGSLKAKWFNQPFMKHNFSLGKEIILSGVVKHGHRTGTVFEMDNPEYEFIDDDADNMIHTSRIVPVYRTTAGLSVRMLRSIIFNAVSSGMEHVADDLPADISTRCGLLPLKESILNSHFPGPDMDVKDLNSFRSGAQKRLSFDELFYLMLGISIMKRLETRHKGIAFPVTGELAGRLFGKLGFELTNAQERVLDEILNDMRRPYPMNRLIQGDVGSGKTVVALLAMLGAVECGYQTALMAPTELLAEQHYTNILPLLQNLGIRICLLTGSTKERPLKDIADGKIDIVLGTHALIQSGIKFRRLGLAVIDEQHRFGVMQRAELRKKALNPDVLVMTATPIPRTLAMTVYGDLDYSVIDALPPGRRPVTTRLFHDNQKGLIYEAMSSEVEYGRQIYVVYPVIEGSENTDLKSAVKGKAALEKMFPRFRIGLIHGKMNTAERESVMLLFRSGKLDILVSTTVIEVGVDVPNAAMMLIVHAERFGLSQLHQLRGRVGRGAAQSHCFLLAYRPYGAEAKRRLEIMVRTTDGFRIAEEDLDIRGPGEFFGTKQSGMPDLKIANIVRDVELLEIARREALAIAGRDPELEQLPLLKSRVDRFWEGKKDIFKTG